MKVTEVLPYRKYLNCNIKYSKIDPSHRTIINVDIQCPNSECDENLPLLDVSQLQVCEACGLKMQRIGELDLLCTLEIEEEPDVQEDPESTP